MEQEAGTEPLRLLRPHGTSSGTWRKWPPTAGCLNPIGTYASGATAACEPKKLRFAVVYYPKTDSFCPDEPNHENLTFWDYCAGAGWQIVTQRDDTHIFYNDGP